ncbi:MAG: SRPBCC family protein [Thermoplasmatota archaeon]
MATVMQTRTTAARPEAIWNILDDFANISKYSKGVATSVPLNNIKSGVGAERKCEFDAKGKQWVEERVTERTDTAMRIAITKTNAPLKFAEGYMQVKPAGSGSQITMTFDMKAKGGPLAPVLEALLMKPSFNKAIKALLADIDAAASP